MQFLMMNQTMVGEHKVRDLVLRACVFQNEDTNQFKARMIKELGVSRFTIYRWMNDSKVSIDTRLCLKLLSFFKQWPELNVRNIEDLFHAPLNKDLAKKLKLTKKGA